MFIDLPLYKHCSTFFGWYPYLKILLYVCSIVKILIVTLWSGLNYILWKDSKMLPLLWFAVGMSLWRCAVFNFCQTWWSVFFQEFNCYLKKQTKNLTPFLDYWYFCPKKTRTWRSVGTLVLLNDSKMEVFARKSPLDVTTRGNEVGADATMLPSAGLCKIYPRSIEQWWQPLSYINED